MSAAHQYRQRAARQRKIARSLPVPALRQRFMTSAERYDRLAQAEEELSSGLHSDAEPETD
jgi:hypothetical protein